MTVKVYLSGEAGGEQLSADKQRLREWLKLGEGKTVDQLATELEWEKGYIESVLIPELITEGSIKTFEMPEVTP